jgi:DNA polymerase-3 subunit epsilon
VSRLLPAPEADGSETGRSLSRVTFGVIDLETTGLSAAHCEILEIGLVVLRHGLKVRRFETLVRPNGPVPSAITGLTGIRGADLEGAPDEASALASLCRVLAEEGVDVLVAHNARFDHGFLSAAWERHLVPDPLLPFLCTVRLARRLVRARRYGLDALVEELRLLPRARHRALGDAEATSDLFAETLRRAAKREIVTLEALESLQFAPVPADVRSARP